MIWHRVERVALGLAIALVAWWLAEVRLDYRLMITKNDALPGPAPALAVSAGDGLAPVPFTRVVLIDGVNLDDALEMPAWDALCARGLDLRVDVGFPTVSLPVQVALWTGLTQQQTGILFHSGFPLADPLGARGIPRQVVGSIAIAESHPYIVQSLGFSYAMPPLGDGKALPPGWSAPSGPEGEWLRQARLAVSGPARLAFVHVLRVDTIGHKKGRASAEWRATVASADRVLAELVAAGDAAHPDARWFLLADHGHVAKGGHGGEERALRIVRACVAGPGVSVGEGGPIALVDLSRAIAESVGAILPKQSRARSLDGALKAPVTDDDVLPRLPRGRVVLAVIFLIAGAVLTALALGRRAVLWGPWWWPVALIAVLIAVGAPTLSQSYVYAPKGDAVTTPALAGTLLAALWTAVGVLLAERRAWRVAIAAIALPLAGLLACLALCGGLPTLWGEQVAPTVPRWSAWGSVLFLITSRGLWACALALLATSVLPGSGRAAPPGTRRSGS